ncbi:MAG: SGNH/GDSL hydrolase family protein [Treponema sp.]|jgi:lysophospholipase L1-like esterase|nr:SGNH/GDSL hydrolase family protein [Treponema sp.]
MKTILCYGDSNTWGYIPALEDRYDHHTRWPCVLRELLNEGSPGGDPAYWVVEEGLNGRTTCREDPIEGDKNGLRQLIPILESHKPLDIVTVMLGTNDLKPRFSPSPYDIAAGAALVVEAVLASGTGPGGGAPEVLWVCPPPTVESPFFEHVFGNAVPLSKKTAPLMEQLAKELGVSFLDAGKAAVSSKKDGIHLDPGEHRKLAEAAAAIIRKM